MMSYQWSHEASEAINSHILIGPPKCPEQIEFASIYVCVQPITVLQDLILSTGMDMFLYSNQDCYYLRIDTVKKKVVPDM